MTSPGSPRLISSLKRFPNVTSAVPIFVGGLVPIGWARDIPLLMSTDNSEKKQAEEQLRVASQYARSLLDASLDPLVIISSDGKIVNPYLINMLGYSREEFVEKKLWQVGAFEDVEVVTVNQSTTASGFAVD